MRAWTVRPITRRAILAVTISVLGASCLAGGLQAAEKLRFAVGPFQPTPGDTKKAYDPFFRHLAQALGVDYDLVVTNDWAGIATALANGQADVAWMDRGAMFLLITKGERRLSRPSNTMASPSTTRSSRESRT